MQQKEYSTDFQYQSVGFLRRLGAILYDALLLFTVLIFSHFPIQLLSDGAAILPGETWHRAYQGYLLAVCFLYFGWFWTHGGQTLGMRTWRICLRDENGKRISWWQSCVRFLSAILSWLVFGIGFLWVLVDKKRMAWHDRLSGTVMVRIPRDPK